MKINHNFHTSIMVKTTGRFASLNLFSVYMGNTSFTPDGLSKKIPKLRII